MRGSMIEVLHSNFIRTAKAKGLSTSRIILKHALRPALLPVITYLGPAFRRDYYWLNGYRKCYLVCLAWAYYL